VPDLRQDETMRGLLLAVVLGLLVLPATAGACPQRSSHAAPSAVTVGPAAVEASIGTPPWREIALWPPAVVRTYGALLVLLAAPAAAVGLQLQLRRRAADLR
jgi:hypothetical protein